MHGSMSVFGMLNIKNRGFIDGLTLFVYSHRNILFLFVIWLVGFPNLLYAISCLSYMWLLIISSGNFYLSTLSITTRISSTLTPSFSVIPAENGLHAWQHLEDLQSNIDLVLTEVFMPCLSGIGLLSKITNHKICKDIPVISK